MVLPPGLTCLGQSRVWGPPSPSSTPVPSLLWLPQAQVFDILLFFLSPRVWVIWAPLFAFMDPFLEPFSFLRLLGQGPEPRAGVFPMRGLLGENPAPGHPCQPSTPLLSLYKWAYFSSNTYINLLDHSFTKGSGQSHDRFRYAVLNEEQWGDTEKWVVRWFHKMPLT